MEIDFDIKADEYKGGFFDRAAVLSALGQFGKRALSLFGVRVRQRARGFIKTRDRVSKPGEGPTNRTDLLRDFIFFAFMPEAADGLGGVVIGPAKLDRKEQPGGPVPKVLEHGGAVSVPQYRTTGRRTRTRYGEVEERVYAGERIAMIAARPYMRPAFDSVYPDEMEDIWERAATGRGLPS